MFEEMAFGAAAMLMLFFAVMIALVLASGWILLPKTGKTIRTSASKLKNSRHSSSEDNYTIFHAVVAALREENKHTQHRCRKTKENNRISNYRAYWNQPELVSQLSDEQREKVTKKFLKLIEKNTKAKQ